MSKTNHDAEYQASLIRREANKDANMQRNARERAAEDREQEKAALARNREALAKDRAREESANPGGAGKHPDLVIGHEGIDAAWFARSKVIPGIIGFGRNAAEAIDAVRDLTMKATQAPRKVVRFGLIFDLLIEHGWQKKRQLGLPLVLEREGFEDITWAFDATHGVGETTRNFLLELGGIDPKWFEDAYGITARKAEEAARLQADIDRAAQEQRDIEEAAKAARRAKIKALEAQGV